MALTAKKAQLAGGKSYFILLFRMQTAVVWLTLVSKSRPTLQYIYLENQGRAADLHSYLYFALYTYVLQPYTALSVFYGQEVIKFNMRKKIQSIK